MMTFFKFFLLIIWLYSCGSGEISVSQKSRLNDSDLIASQIDTQIRETIEPDKGEFRFITESVDSTVLIDFWNNITGPMINGNMNKVLSTIKFPLDGEWMFMAGINKDGVQGTKQDFIKAFPKLFNNDLVSGLKNGSFKDVEVAQANDTLYFSFGVGKNIGDNQEFEGAVRFRYVKSGDRYYLIMISGAGGDFYGN